MNCYLPVVLVRTRFTLRLIRTVLQSSQTFLPGKQFGLMSNLNLPICNFWPSPLAPSPAIAGKGLSLLEEALLILPAAFCGVSPLHLSSWRDRRPGEQNLHF